MARRRSRAQKKERRKSFNSFLWRLLLLVAALALAISYLSIFINPSVFSVPLFFGLFFIPLLILNLLLLVISLLMRSNSVWISLIVILPSFIFTESYFRLSDQVESNERGLKLKIESYNVGMFSSSAHGYARADCRNLIMSHLKSEKPDIVALQECFLSSERMADTLLAKEYPYRTYHLFKLKSGQRFGNIILSKYPIAASADITFKRSTNLCVYADIEVDSDTIRICNNHLESYNVSFTSLVKGLSSKGGYETGLADELIDVHEKMKGTNIRRSSQVNEIIRIIDQSRYPSVICGDFNDTPISYTYNRFVKLREDTFKLAGRGFAGTFRHLWPLLRIDYILIPKGWDCTSHKSPKLSYSDHFPVISEIVI